MSKIIFINLRNVREDNDLKQKDLAKLFLPVRIHTMKTTKEKCQLLHGNFFPKFLIIVLIFYALPQK